MDLLKHLKTRGLDPSRYRGISWDNDTATFRLWNLSGQLVGYQQYRPTGDKAKCNDRDVGKYYTYTKDNIAVWGLETLDYRKDILFLTEGVFDAVKLHALNLPAIAVLSNNPQKIRGWLYALPRRIIAAVDNDTNNSGEKLASCASQYIVAGRRVPYKLVPQKANSDLGDMSVAEVRLLISKQLPWLKL